MRRLVHELHRVKKSSLNAKNWWGCGQSDVQTFLWLAQLVSFDGWRIGQSNFIDVLLLVSSALSPPNFTLIGNDDFFTNLVWKSWRFWVFADTYLGQIESEKNKQTKKTQYCSYTSTFFSACAVLCPGRCASNFQVLTRKSAGAAHTRA